MLGPPVFEPPPSPGLHRAPSHPHGQATHLGQYTMDYTHRVNQESLTGIGNAVLNVPKGDTLKTDVTGTATPDEQLTAFTTTDTHMVTGGTGRFAGAAAHLPSRAP